MLSLWPPVRWYTCIWKNSSSIIASTLFCVSARSPCVAARLSSGTGGEVAGAFWTKKKYCALSLAKCRPRCGRGVECGLDTGKLYFTGAADRHNPGGRLTRTLGRGQCRAHDLRFGGHSVFLVVHRGCSGVLAGEPAARNACRSAPGHF